MHLPQLSKLVRWLSLAWLIGGTPLTSTSELLSAENNDSDMLDAIVAGIESNLALLGPVHAEMKVYESRWIASGLDSGILSNRVINKSMWHEDGKWKQSIVTTVLNDAGDSIPYHSIACFNGTRTQTLHADNDVLQIDGGNTMEFFPRQDFGFSHSANQLFLPDFIKSAETVDVQTNRRNGDIFLLVTLEFVRPEDDSRFGVNLTLNQSRGYVVEGFRFLDSQGRVIAEREKTDYLERENADRPFLLSTATDSAYEYDEKGQKKLVLRNRYELEILNFDETFEGGFFSSIVLPERYLIDDRISGVQKYNIEDPNTSVTSQPVGDPSRWRLPMLLLNGACLLVGLLYFGFRSGGLFRPNHR